MTPCHLDLRRLLACSTLVASATVPFAAPALAAPTLRAAIEPQRIDGGAPVQPCGFPAAAELQIGSLRCSAVLIHPRVLVLDDTCPNLTTGYDEFDFSFNDGTNPDAGRHAYAQRSNCTFDGDLGVCVLDAPTAVPFTPIAAGCELAAIHDGAPAVVVGMGATSPEQVYDDSKHYGEVTIEDVSEDTFFAHGDAAPCNGDSGAPAFVQVADGSWRVAGVALSTTCDNPSPFGRLTPMIPWIESTTGIDVTPCHDADGFPDVSEACVGFYAGGSVDDGTWTNSCQAVPVGPPGGVCSGDDDPPAVEIVAPATSPTSLAEPGSVRVEIAAEDSDGVGLRDVRLQIDGQIQPMELTAPPFVFDVDFPLGSWSVVAIARDWGGNVGESTILEVDVGPQPDDGDDDGGGGDSSTGAGTTTDAQDTEDAAPVDGSTTGSDTPTQDSGTSGGCAVSGRGTSGAWFLVIAALGWRRRDRSSPASTRACSR